MGVLGAEKCFAGIDAAEDVECAAGLFAGLTEFLETVVDPIHEEDLLIEFVGGGGDEFAELVAVAEFVKFWVVGGIEFEEAGVFGVDVREG